MQITGDSGRGTRCDAEIRMRWTKLEVDFGSEEHNARAVVVQANSDCDERRITSL